jgi:hypothetical protein
VGSERAAASWKQPCPIAVGFGGHPLIFLMGGAALPMGVDELTWVGAIAGHRVPVIKGHVTGLPIPADGEIVIEGDVIEGDTMMRGHSASSQTITQAVLPNSLLRSIIILFQILLGRLFSFQSRLRHSSHNPR